MNSQTKKQTKEQTSKVLKRYFGSLQVEAGLADKVLAFLNGERIHRHYQTTFFTHREDDGKIVLTSDSYVKKFLRDFLIRNGLDDEYAERCIGELIETPYREKKTTITDGKSTYSVIGAHSIKYFRLLEYKPKNKSEEKFQKMFIEVLNDIIEVKSFRVPIYQNGIECDMTDYDYLTLQEYILLLASRILSHIEMGKDETEAWNRICSEQKNQQDVIFPIINDDDWEIDNQYRYIIPTSRINLIKAEEYTKIRGLEFRYNGFKSDVIGGNAKRLLRYKS